MRDAALEVAQLPSLADRGHERGDANRGDERDEPGDELDDGAIVE